MGNPDGDSARVPPDETPTGRRPRWRSRIALAVAAAVVVFLSVPVYLTSSARQCATCHEMRPYYDSWHTSSHRAAAPNCRFCHVKPGVLNYVVYELTFYREILGHFTRAEIRPDGPNAPSALSCQRGTCHSLNREASYSGDLKINHRAHVADEEIECHACHPGIVHGADGRSGRTSATLCRECHEAEMTDCTYCHDELGLSEEPPESH